ncbi:MAG: peptide deformylase [Lachnospiraceae bacterium]|nr:peptide deformylase [Lachnospiraceae bacterium]
MAIRNIRIMGDPVLAKECKKVTQMTERTQILIGDMLDTMYDAQGVGLAAPQVGILKSICVVDITEDRSGQYVLINPEIIEADGSQTGEEGCLSLPGKQGTVTRPQHVVVKALNEKMEEVTIEADGLLARAFCHEIDHLHGHMYVEKVEGELKDTERAQEDEE